MEIKSYGKFNLFLKVYKKHKKKDLHKIKSLFVPFKKSYDVIKVRDLENGFKFIEKKGFLHKKNNTIVRAAKYFFWENPQIKPNIEIELIKNMHPGSGLGFSASNAVATYRILHKFFNINLEEVKLIKFAKYISSDATFFVFETPLIIYGEGDKFKNYSKEIQEEQFKIVINEDLVCETKKVYACFNENYSYYSKNYNKHGPFFNYLELPAFDLYPQLYKKYNELNKKYDYVMLCGSGSSFICFNDSKSKGIISKILKNSKL